jgi:hypothetical protein
VNLVILAVQCHSSPKIIISKFNLNKKR